MKFEEEKSMKGGRNDVEDLYSNSADQTNSPLTFCFELRFFYL